MENEIWTVKRILDWIEGYLSEKGDENSRLSAQWLVSEALGVSRIQLFMDPERPLSMEERDILRGYTRRRGAGEPLQYITGTTDFRFITVQVEHGVLIPRPETEVLVSEALAELDTASKVKAARRIDYEEEPQRSLAFEVDPGDCVMQQHCEPCSNDENLDSEPLLRVLDLCTGTGCIACSIASEVPHAHVVATDIDPRAVRLAVRNAESLCLGGRVTVLECDLASAVPKDLMGSFSLLISNPPYIPTAVLGEMDAEVVNFESSLALDGGNDGLDIFRRILPVAMEALCSGGVLALELHETCLGQAAREACEYGFENVRIAEDLAGRQRVLVARKG